jgi:hypothetical protein
MRRAAKRDANERSIIEALVDSGCLVMQLDKFDLLIRTPAGDLLMYEVKSDTGQVTASQRKLLEDGWPLKIVRSPQEALTVVENQ